ncbi:MAG: FAD-binding domain-containing protein [Hyphomicrobiaceae bacterium]|nr:FAD-binding domain-containing protein [Hyphomicrobiaceae bacterium]
MQRDPVHIVWFKRDLRIEDHAPLAMAARRGTVLPLYIVEPDLWAQADVSARQWDFTRACLCELDLALGRLGQRLIVRVGPAVDVLERIAAVLPVAGLWSHEETGNGWTFQRDRAVTAWARSRGLDWVELRQTGVQRRLKQREGWARAWDRQMGEPVAAPPRGLPSLGAIDSERLPDARDLGLHPDGLLEPQAGGRHAGLDLLHGFLTTRAATYRRAMSSPLAGAGACSRLSPHLALGTLSMKEVAQATQGRIAELDGERGAGPRAFAAALRSFAGRLHWHCHFMQKLESEPAMEFRELHPATRGLRPGSTTDAHRLAAWAAGETGFPFLDASMRFLRATGWLNFRMRAMAVSFASYNLWLPWRLSGLHLARQFTDYEPGIHWPQVQMQSGTTGINTIRIYNVVKQGYDQDPSGVFVRRWVPELADVPDCFVQEPWRWEGADGVIGKSYPARIVDLKSSTADAKERIYGVRSGHAFAAAASDIQEKHGSRKSGIPMTGQRRTSSRRPSRKTSPVPTKAQLKLDF